MSKTLAKAILNEPRQLPLDFQAKLDEIHFNDPDNAKRILERLLSNAESRKEVLSFFLSAVASAADPDRSIMHFERMAERFGESLFQELTQNTRLVEILITLFSVSPFLTEILLATPEGLQILTRRSALTERKTVDEFYSEAQSAYQQYENENDQLDALRRYQRRQLLRIGVSDFLDFYDLRTVFSQLSRMAIGIVRACLALATEACAVSASGFTVLAMGKLGARELNYSSDIDLLFVTRQDTEGHLALGKKLIDILSRTTGDGFLYRVDMRLRPWGHDGPLVTTLEAYQRYFKESALLWEKQAFLKARPIAGNLTLGEELRKLIEPMLYSLPAEEVRAGIFAMKQRTEEFLQEKGRKWGEVKLGEGSIRDVEFVVQALQMTHPAIHTRSILKAIPQLRDEKLLAPIEARTLLEGYIFLRTVEHYLQITEYQQTYTLPADPYALTLLARRLGFEGAGAGDRFIESYEKHSRAIRAIFLKYIGNLPVEEPALSDEEILRVKQHVARMHPSYIQTFTPTEVALHTLLTEQLTFDQPVIVDAQPVEEDRWRVTVVGYDFLGVFSLVCGLLFLYGLDILESQIFSYETTRNVSGTNGNKKIVDVFIVRSLRKEVLQPSFWQEYAQDLNNFILKVQSGRRREAQGELAKRVGASFQDLPAEGLPLYPVEIEIDNRDEKYTILRIEAPDTAGFLFEFSHALALSHINIVRMQVQTIGNRASDTLYVTDDKGHKIESPKKQRELRAATVLIKHFTHLLPSSPNPESALLHFREFLFQLFERPNWVDEFTRIEQPEVLNALARLLGVSDFLWDDFLRMQYSNLFPIVQDVKALEKTTDRQHLESDLDKAITRAKNWREALNAFKDREMFRIDMRHILGYSQEFGAFSAELTDLVEVVLAKSLTLCKQELIKQHGQPLLESGIEANCSLLALGKCGGRELGFASDIELMLVYSGQGKTRGRKSISVSGFYETLIQSVIQSIYARQEGVFHIDLQLRPYGKAGSQAVSYDSFSHYYAPEGEAWPYERQALVKMRPIAGDQAFARKLCELRDQYVYGGIPFDVTAMRAMREKQVRHIVAAGTFNAKFSQGGLVDIEYLVQGLQINLGSKDPELRLTNIREAMAALHQKGYLSTGDYDRLRKAHTFMRWLIDSLRVVRGNAKDVTIPPVNSEEFAFLARRLQYGSDVSRLADDLTRYPQDVQELNQKLLPAG